VYAWVLAAMRRLERTRAIPRSLHVGGICTFVERLASPTPLWKAFSLNKSDGSSRSRLHRLRRKLHDLTRVAKLSGSSSSYIRKPEGSVQPTLYSTVREIVDLSYWRRPVLDSPSDLSLRSGSRLKPIASMLADEPGRRRSERLIKS
jgi:hypothetical protein